MSYIILLMTLSLVLAMIFHLKHQYQKTAKIRQTLHEARVDKYLTGLHYLKKGD